jgi:hypothetical protein
VLWRSLVAGPLIAALVRSKYIFLAKYVSLIICFPPVSIIVAQVHYRHVVSKDCIFSSLFFSEELQAKPL